MTTVLAVELRRYLARRLTRVLIGLALAATAVAGIVVFVNAEKPTAENRARAAAQREADVAGCARSFGREPGFGPDGAFRAPPQGPSRTPAQAPADLARAEAECRRIVAPAGYDKSLHLVDLWHADGGDAFLAVTFVFLGIGALIGGASMVGAEWKAGTLTTMLTWEPRRLRVALAKLLAAGLLAATVAVVLQGLFSAALLPTVVMRGTTAGAGAEWFRDLLAAVGRGAVLTGVGAMVGASVAIIGRSTAAALGLAFAYLTVVEGVVRAWKPTSARWLLGENATIFLTGRRLENAPFDRPVGLAAVTLLGVTAGLVALAVCTFRTRDVAA